MLVKRRAVLVATAVSCVLAIGPGTAQGYSELNPGGTPKFGERVPVNVVFVGYDQDDAPWAAVRSQLPATAAPIVRSRAFYGIDERLGLDYAYDYRPHYTSRAWEDGFFSHLASLAVRKPLTEFQVAYNEQAGNVLDVTQNSWIDPAKVEKRLIDAAPAGVDTRVPTIFFINWHGRRDFRFHVYAKTGEPDPDTGHDFGALSDDRKIVAWGGTTPDDEETGLGGRGVHRVWFYDLSAGPEAWAGNFDVDDADLDGDGVADYRIPVSGSTAATARARSSRATSARSSATSGSICCSRAHRCIRRTSRRTACPGASTSTSTPSRAGPGSTPPRPTSRAASSAGSCPSCRPATRSRATIRICRSPATSAAAT